MREFAPSRWNLLPLALVVFTAALGGCSAKASETAATKTTTESVTQTEPAKGATIDIEPGGPADTVRAFYKHLRDGNVRAAIFLTNMRPAIEGLTDAELKEFQVDFERLSVQVPAEVKINGEIVSGDKATVTVEMQSDEGKVETQPIQLRREKTAWVLVSVDKAGERLIRADGKNYLYNLRLESHHDEGEAMLRRIAKAQLAYSAQNGGTYADLRTLVDEQLLPEDALSAASTGYVYAVGLGGDRKAFTATATPAEYGKSGKLSFLLAGGSIAKRDNGGKPLTKQ
jgi:Tfp pilus assembly protein PilE